MVYAEDTGNICIQQSSDGVNTLEMMECGVNEELQLSERGEEGTKRGHEEVNGKVIPHLI
jgi:hypothetical protein